jgi:hypothetical protein
MPHPATTATSPSVGSSSRGLYGSQIGANMARAGAAELVGTFLLVFTGTAVAVSAALMVPSSGRSWTLCPTIVSSPAPALLTRSCRPPRPVAHSDRLSGDAIRGSLSRPRLPRPQPDPPLAPQPRGTGEPLAARN